MLIAASSEELQMVIGHNCFSTAIPTSHCRSQAKIVFAKPGNTLVFKDSTYFFFPGKEWVAAQNIINKLVDESIGELFSY